MARIAGVNLPRNKRIVIALTYIFGIGHTTAGKIIAQLGLNPSIRVYELNADQVLQISDYITKTYTVEGDLRRRLSMDLKALMDLGSYRGLRHRKRLPVRGQRTHTNARTRKGKAKPIAGKKK